MQVSFFVLVGLIVWGTSYTGSMLEFADDCPSITKSALRRFQSFVTVCDFSALASCYAELNGRLRPTADIDFLYGPGRCYQPLHL